LDTKDSKLSAAQRYNKIVLSHLTGKAQSAPGHDDMARQLEAFKKNYTMDHLTARKRRRNELILGYNHALVLFSQGKWSESATMCMEHLNWQSSTKQQDKSPPIQKVASRMALLLLENLLAMKQPTQVQPQLHPSSSTRKAPGQSDEATSAQAEDDGKNKSDGTTTEEKFEFPDPDDVIAWLEKLGLDKQGGDAQFKFLLSLYKGRVDLAVRSTESGLHEEARIRSARKELKIAMEVFNNKLRPSNTDSVSVVSSVHSDEVANSKTDGDTASSEGQQHHGNHPQPHSHQHQSIVLQKLNQSALNLKANLEQLKGNVKKSLILCSEAVSSTPQPSQQDESSLASANSHYDAIHANNLGIVYQTSHKRNLALHVLSKALKDKRVNSEEEKTPELKPPSLFLPDGTASPDSSLGTVRNAALCALQARKYLTSYTCWALSLLKNKSGASDQGLTWLRLAEACLGLHHDLELTDKPYYSASPIQVNGVPRGLVIEQQAHLKHYQNIFGDENAGDTADDPEVSLPPLGSPEDMDMVTRMPLKRARYALERAINHPTSQDETRHAANLCLAYISLVARDYVQALELSIAVILSTASEDEILPSSSKTDGSETSKRAASDDKAKSDSSGLASVLDSARMRRRATARMYAAEASCCLGDGLQAMQFLAGDGSDADAFNRLASDLGGVDVETAAASDMGKRRLSQAQSQVRSSASAVTAAMGNLAAAKQLAMSAQAMEDAAYQSGEAGAAVFESSSFTRSRSAARQALIYCLLRTGNNSAALSLLQSSR